MPLGLIKGIKGLKKKKKAKTPAEKFAERGFTRTFKDKLQKYAEGRKPENDKMFNADFRYKLDEYQRQNQVTIRHGKGIVPNGATGKASAANPSGGGGSNGGGGSKTKLPKWLLPVGIAVLALIGTIVAFASRKKRK